MSFKINTKNELMEFAINHWSEANEYLDNKMQGEPVPFYTSVDIRESHEKFAPVDNNIYPAGFNNLCKLDLEYAATIMRKTILEIKSDAKVVAIIPEAHTKNLFYLDHLAILGKTVEDAGFSVCFISPDEHLFEGQEKLELVSHSGYDLTFQKMSIEEKQLCSCGNKADLIILNNDQSTEFELDWNKLETPVVPTPLIGWYQRSKITHFEHYKKAAEDFCEHFSINPDLVQAKFVTANDVDFSSKQGLENLSAQVDNLLQELPKDSRVFIKGAQGTYGMGISVVSSGSEVLEMNRKARKKMDIGKSGIKFTSLIIQEGIKTVLKYEDNPAEVTIYQIGGKSVGGFMRTNTQRDEHSNLNAKGMVFKKFCISEIQDNQDFKASEALYSLLARISTLAAAYEIKNVL